MRTMWVGDMHVCRKDGGDGTYMYPEDGGDGTYMYPHVSKTHPNPQPDNQHTPFSKLNKPICIYIHVHLKKPYVHIQYTHMYSTVLP